MSPRASLPALLLLCGGLLLHPRGEGAEGRWVCVPAAEGGGWGCTWQGRGAPAAPAAPTVRAPAPPATAPARTGARPPATAPVAAAPPAERASCPAPQPLAERGRGRPEERATASLQVEAARSEMRAGRVGVFEGDVTLERADQRLRANRVVYDRAAATVEAEGEVRYGDTSLELAAARARMELDADRGRFERVRYRLPAGGGRGEAARIETEGRARARLEQVSYTTCPPQAEAWRLLARRIDLDRARGRGSARHATLRLGRVPVLYSPYLSFPIDKRRRTGFLAPGLGRSDRTGTDVRIPWYWNIAPNYDATLVPRWMGERGLQLGAELRYLTSASRGEIQGEYLRDDRRTGDDRGLARLRHRSRWGAWRLDVDATSVSDARYFEDLGTSLAAVSATHLEQRAELGWASGRWSARLRAQAFQTVDPSIAPAGRPYRRLPQLRLSLAPGRGPLGLSLSGRLEAVRFDHEDASRTRGTRIDVRPRLSWPVQRPGWFVEPAVAVRHTRYRLDNPGAGMPGSPSRTLPTASLDAGLFLEKRLAGGRLLHTIEPRLYYLYVPYESQDDLPVFDTGLLDFSWAQLFREDRFSGPDRVGDANQLTLAVTTRLLETATGTERLSVGIGQIRYFRDRRVVLPGGAVDGRRGSNLVLQVSALPWRPLRLSATLQWDPDPGEVERAGLDLRYRADAHRILNLGYRFRRGTLEQADLAGRWRLATAWHVVGRWSRSLREGADLERFAGLEHASCCWAARVVWREYVAAAGAEANRALLLQLELKGLGSVGERVDRLLERGILGYRRGGL